MYGVLQFMLENLVFLQRIFCFFFFFFECAECKTSAPDTSIFIKAGVLVIILSLAKRLMQLQLSKFGYFLNSESNWRFLKKVQGFLVIIFILEMGTFLYLPRAVQPPRCLQMLSAPIECRKVVYTKGTVFFYFPGKV